MQSFVIFVGYASSGPRGVRHRWSRSWNIKNHNDLLEGSYFQGMLDLGATH